ncbi:TylF/MycF family methyltransferase [Gammaproteobacteria bacterium]|nr:TylF/MycF family methyltransferase [Gammaproteobacteria bacterium]
MDIVKILNSRESDFVYAALEIENHRKDNASSRLRFWFNHCRENFDKVDGDIFEYGVYKGNSIISMAVLLKRLGSDKKIYGFDSFRGFPEYHEKDDLESFRNEYSENFPSKIIDDYNLIERINYGYKKTKLTPKNISSSKEFDDNNIQTIKEKIELLNLDNIVLIEGDFKETVPSFFDEFDGSIFSANVDCDLYDGYKISLPYTFSYLEKGGYIHLDEYYSLKFPGARIACNEFFKEHSIVPELQNTPVGEFERWYVTK